MRKRWVENAAISGLPLTGKDVARKVRGKGVLVLRHDWPDGADGRVLDAVRRAYMDLARETAARIGKAVEVHSRGGWLLACVEAPS